MPTHPTAPYAGYIQAVAEETAARQKTMRFPAPAHEGAPPSLIDALTTTLHTLSPEIIALSQQLHAHPETGFEEHESVAAILEVLDRHGIEAEKGAYGVETAFEAQAGTGGPVVAVLSEYDALPEIGHACGHNIIAAAGLGAFLALAQVLADHPEIEGTVKYLGTPAEEGMTGKEHMARGGAFQPGDIDAAIMVHPYMHDLADQVWLGRRVLTVTFHGIAAHASAQPFMGRNALDAANLAYQGIGLLRQQMPPVDRIHAIITKGGTRQSIITETAEMKFYVRSKYPGELKHLSERVEDIVNGAALMAGVGVEIDWDEHPPSLPLKTNNALTSRWVEAQRRRGREPLPLGVVTEQIAASTDFGNVSYRVPGMHPLIKIAPEDHALHTRGFAEAAKSPDGDRGAIDAAYGLASVALDFLTDEALRNDVREEFGEPVDVERFFD